MNSQSSGGSSGSGAWPGGAAAASSSPASIPKRTLFPRPLSSRSATASTADTAFLTLAWYSRCVLYFQPNDAPHTSLIVLWQVGNAFSQGNSAGIAVDAAIAAMISGAGNAARSSGLSRPCRSKSAIQECIRSAAATRNGDQVATAFSQSASGWWPISSA